MVETRECTFCGDEIEPGTGKMYVNNDGTVDRYCSGKCEKNHRDLDRVPRDTEWTRHHEQES